MGPQSLSALHRLQEVETHLRSLKDMLRRKERQLQQHQVRIKQLEEQQTSKHNEILHRQSHINQLELEFKSREAGLTKLRTQLNVAKSNKEYSAILTQLNTERADNSKLEERILREMGEVDEIKKAQAEMKSQFEEQKAQVSQHEAEFQIEKEKLQEHINQLERQRDEMTQGVPPSDLAVFQRVADRLNGEAMAKILKPDPNVDEYNCDGCNMGIPVEIVNALLTKDEIQVCPICSRILYLESEVRSGT